MGTTNWIVRTKSRCKTYFDRKTIPKLTNSFTMMKFLAMFCLFIALFNEMEAKPIEVKPASTLQDRAESSDSVDDGVEEGDKDDEKDAGADEPGDRDNYDYNEGADNGGDDGGRFHSDYPEDDRDDKDEGDDGDAADDADKNTDNA